jgi:predicted transcriptional regulator
LRILESKGYLRHTKRSRAFVYEPLIAQEEASRTALGYLVNRFFAGSRELLVVNLLKGETISRAELRRIKKMIAESEGVQR